MALQQLIIKSNVANQIIIYTANTQNIGINLYFRGFQNYNAVASNITLGKKTSYIMQKVINKYAPPTFYADIKVNNVLIIAGSRVIDRTPINIYPTNMIGYIVSIDSTGNEDPTINNLGKNVQLYYVDTFADILGAKT